MLTSAALQAVARELPCIPAPRVRLRNIGMWERSLLAAAAALACLCTVCACSTGSGPTFLAPPSAVTECAFKSARARPALHSFLAHFFPAAQRTCARPPNHTMITTSPQLDALSQRLSELGCPVDTSTVLFPGAERQQVMVHLLRMLVQPVPLETLLQRMEAEEATLSRLAPDERSSYSKRGPSSHSLLRAQCCRPIAATVA